MSVTDVSQTDSLDDLILRRRANSLLPVSRLPSEILVNIFDECRGVEDRSYWWDLWRASWLVCTHVCQYWRHVALSAPMLWNNVGIGPLTDEEELKTWLDRSGTATLEVIIRGHRSADIDSKGDGIHDSILVCLAQELPRIGMLDICVTWKTFLSLKWPISSSTLEDLSLFALDQTTSPEVHELFSLRLYNRFPNLKRLLASNAGFGFNHWILPSTMTHLTIVNSTTSPSDHTLQDILQSLKHLPHLEHIRLENALPPNIATDTPFDRPVVLPSLQSLSLSGPLHEQLTLLHAMELGPSVRLKLQLVLHDSFTHAENLLSPSFYSYLSGIRPLLAVMIYVQGEHRSNNGIAAGRCEFSFAAWQNTQSMESSRGHGRFCIDEDPMVHITFSVLEHTVMLSPALARSSLAPLERLLSRFPLSHVQSLTMDCMYGPMFNAPLVLSKMSQLRKLCICGGLDRCDGVQGLLRQLDLIQVIGDNTILFPNLETLILSRIQCRGASNYLAEVLHERCQLQGRSNTPLKLVLKSCYHLNESYVEGLRQFAVVEWDGIEVQSYRELALLRFGS
ncbi:hypothetical protein EIP86_008775 [Pleurotus ostreatoroseus]|nr:hypothetical protein EIP86_008775 [Pleurotus ostreatoroseus]